MITTISNGILEISVNNFGAELSSLKTVADNLQFLWQGDAKYWTGQSYNLFPLIGGLVDNKYQFNGNTYELNSHGFARNSEFQLYEKTDKTLVYKLTHSEATLKQYPFEFEFYVSYTLEGNSLLHGYKVVNLSRSEMLFSLGAHPGFNCPLYENESITDYKIVFEKAETLTSRIKEGKTLSGERIDFMENENIKPLSHQLFYRGAAILDAVKSNWLVIENDVNNHSIRVDFEGFPYLGIWSAANDAPFVCIEPWFGLDSTKSDSYDFTLKEGLQKLSSGNSFQCEYKITLN